MSTLKRTAASALPPPLDSIPGVVEHGIFLNECDELVIEKAGGVERVLRSDLK